jgi:hypothetical protein
MKNSGENNPQLGWKNSVNEITTMEQVKHELSYLCSSINLPVSLDFLFEYYILVSFSCSFAKIKCIIQDKTYCSTKEPLRALYGTKKWILSNLLYDFLLCKRQRKRHKLNSRYKDKHLSCTWDCIGPIFA